MVSQQPARPIESKPPLAPALALGSLRQPDLAPATDVKRPDTDGRQVVPLRRPAAVPSSQVAPAAAGPAASLRQAPNRPPVGHHSSASMAAAAGLLDAPAGSLAKTSAREADGQMQNGGRQADSARDEVRTPAIIAENNCISNPFTSPSSIVAQ